MHAGITAITELAVKNGQTKSVAFGTQPEFESPYYIHDRRSSRAITLGHCRVENERETVPPRVKYWEIIADNLSKDGWSWGCVSALILADEQSGLLTHIAATESVSLCERMKS
jgi:hypothetical protein